MEKRAIGSLSVSVVGLGCNNFGIRLDQARTSAVVDAALDAGINFFDTADVYGGTHSEELLGRALGARRKQVLVASKFGMPVDEQRQGAHPAYIERAVEDSLRRLGTDYLDLYQLHRPDPSVPLADTLGALDELVRAGKVREIGSSNFSVAQIREAEGISKSSKGARFVSVQNEYSLLQREPEAGVLAETLAHEIGFLPFFPLASGLLTGKYRPDQPNPSGTRLTEPGSRQATRFLTDDKVARAHQLLAFAESRGHTLLELAFSWLRENRAVSSIIAGATSPEQIRQNVAAVGWHLSADELGELDRISPR
jgi:aryl-alcohol dehydrogenase-like predicted oxidoreductase